jgi:LIVCS family branched-chain amino acid:cation transporter
MMDWVGKFLTPGILIILALVIIIGIFGDYEPVRTSLFASPFTEGLLEGYQTFDAIGGVVVGAVVVISLGLKGGTFIQKKKVLLNGGILAGIGLLLIYGGMLYLGSLQSGTLEETDRTALLTKLSADTLGSMGANLLAILVSLACFTTAVGIVTGTADFIKGLCKDSRIAYLLTAFFASALGVVMGQMDVHGIIDVAVPALMFIYPITIVLIFLNALPQRFASPIVFKVVVIVTMVFSLPDFLASIGFSEQIRGVSAYIPLVQQRLAWVVPACLAFIIVNMLKRKEE